MFGECVGAWTRDLQEARRKSTEEIYGLRTQIGVGVREEGAGDRRRQLIGRRCCCPGGGGGEAGLHD